MIIKEIKSVFGMEFTNTNYTLLSLVIEQNWSEISNSSIFQQAFRSVANSFTKTTEEQLADFLPGGEYYKPVNMEKKQTLLIQLILPASTILGI